MSIHTLAKKVRAQRAVSTRTGWTLATTKSGLCGHPCGGGAPAKQKSMRQLLAEKVRGGGPTAGGMDGRLCCTNTWKPVDNQSSSEYLWKIKQMTLNCIGGCGCGKQHGVLLNSTGGIIAGPSTFIGGCTYLFSWTTPGDIISIMGISPCSICTSMLVKIALGANEPLIIIGSGPTTNSFTVNPNTDPNCSGGRCDNTGCRCNCSRLIGESVCCVVHKDVDTLSISENLPNIVNRYACFKGYLGSCPQCIEAVPRNNSC